MLGAVQATQKTLWDYRGPCFLLSGAVGRLSCLSLPGSVPELVSCCPGLGVSL